MTRPKKLTNVAASVRQRLLNLARDRNADFNLILQRFAGERFLYRLSVSGEVDRFTLKGAALFRIWSGREFRATRDIDLLSSSPGDRSTIRRSVERICAVPYSEDGLSFDPASIRVEDIREEREYHGVRVKLRASLGTAALPLQIDIGFGDSVIPERRDAEYPTLLDHPAPRLWTYPRESFVAEKFEAMVRLGPVNSRMKDFWDVAALAQQFTFDGETLQNAIGETFSRRRTPLTGELPDALRPAFYEDAARVRQWEAFQDKVGSGTGFPATFDEVGEQVRAFLGPIRESLVHDEPFTQAWPAGGPWKTGPSRNEGGEGGA